MTVSQEMAKAVIAKMSLCWIQL